MKRDKFNLIDVYLNNPSMVEIARKTLHRCDMKHLEHAIKNDLDEPTKEACDCMDMIKCHYRWYLIGHHQTLHRVMHEIRRYKQAFFYERKVLMEIIETIEQEVLNRELYEAMPRHLQAKRKILKAIDHD
ncbi:hypothetical protein [Carboxylicivirga marina]|uniref:Uncharacterized protein n=1 Tax=Carboxylicivirga marina TaxID=2800988 RepID=A0ABS1HQ32_9BACT|nr:hypothetical protein [Carboxylicivirga marina]MBK3519725.1 hypothetical protein [Carboxylicivirga marina]